VWLRIIGKEGDLVLTADPKRGIRSYFWTYEPDKLILRRMPMGMKIIICISWT